MEVIKLQSEAFQQIISKLDQLKSALEKTKQPLTDTWLDIQETCQLLKISKRTLQGYRKGILPYSQVEGKIYFLAKDIEDHLMKHYKKVDSNK